MIALFGSIRPHHMFVQMYCVSDMSSGGVSALHCFTQSHLRLIASFSFLVSGKIYVLSGQHVFAAATQLMENMLKERKEPPKWMTHGLV